MPRGTATAPLLDSTSLNAGYNLSVIASDSEAIQGGTSGSGLLRSARNDGLAFDRLLPGPRMKRRQFASSPSAAGRCLCGVVRFEVDYPAFWAWHDHSRASRVAHGAAYSTYVGTWRKRFRITAGEDEIARYEDKASGGVRH